MHHLYRKDAPNSGNLERLAVPFEIKSVDDKGLIEGYGSVFHNIDWYKEKIAPGAFTRSLEEHTKAGTMPAMLWQHYSDQVPGVWTSMSEDKRGLRTAGELILDTQLGRESHALTKRKAVNGLSIGFVTRKSDTDDKTGIRTLLDIDLWEVSIVTFPANPKARITGVKQLPANIRDFEDYLREAGFSSNQAKAIASRGFKAADDARDEQAALEEVRQLVQRNINIFKP